MIKKILLFIPFIVMAAAVIFVVYPMLQPGWFDVHDPTAVIRLSSLRQSLMDGQLPAAWDNSLNYGYGYPLHLYYAPVFTYLSAIFSLFTPSLLVAVKLTLIFCVSLAAFGMYRLTSRYGQLNAALATVCYTILPYHALTLYVRGASAEVMVWSILPWLLYYWSRPIEGRRSVSLTAITTAIFLMSHNTVVWFLLPVIILAILFIHKPPVRNFAIVTLLLSILLSSFSIVPVIFEQSFIQAQTIATQTKLVDHFLSVSQLWHSDWGYGGSASHGLTDGMSFMLGKLPLVLLLLSLTRLVLTRSLTNYKLVIISITIAFAYATTSHSSWLWDLFPLTHIVQFPWRLLIYASLGIAYMSAWLIPAKIGDQKGSALLLVLSVLLIYFSYPFFKPQSIKDYNDQTFLETSVIKSVARDKFPEYLPAWTPSFSTSEPSDGLTRTATSVTGKITNTTLSTLNIETAYMPHWRLNLNGYPTDIIPNEDGTIRTHTVIPPGEYEAELTWHKTPIEIIGAAISLVTLVIVLGLAL